MRTYKNFVAGILGGLLIVFTLQSAYAEHPRVILVTGFEPFGGDSTNSSWEAVRNFDGKHFNNATVVVAQLPVVWGKAAEKLHELTKTHKPVAVISFGQAGEGPVLLETTAHNVRENIQDNKKMLPQTLQVYSHATPALKTMLPLPEIEARLRAEGIPVRLSQDAGTYLCNDIFYTLMYDPGTNDTKEIPRGFVHVPPLNANVRTKVGDTVIFDKILLQKTAELIIQTVADTLSQNQ
jgi:pyroglutamyl-peptidase